MPVVVATVYHSVAISTHAYYDGLQAIQSLAAFSAVLHCMHVVLQAQQQGDTG